MRKRLEDLFRRKTRDEWCAILEGTDVCFAPVLTLGEAPSHPHNKARGAFVELDGVVQPAPAPRFSATPLELRSGPPAVGADTGEALADWGFSGTEIAALLEAGAAWQNPKKK
jgi:alpha-methylacyl-CoA racemase